LINLSQVRTNLDELNLEEIQKTATDLIASIKKFDFQEFFHLYSLVDETAKEIKDKDIVLLLGSTGSGKSTTTHYLCGSLLEKVVSEKNKLEHIQAVKIVCRDLQKVKISNASRSETRYITPIKVELDKIGSSQKKTVILVDSPGAEDTESYEVDIANMLGIIKAIHHAKTVRPIILVSFMK
jgi:predicted GTPase